ncbi:ROK family protein, partial [Methylophaga sp.]
SNAEQIYQELPKRLPNYVFGGECDTPVVQAVHGDSSGVRGAAWLGIV